MSMQQTRVTVCLCTVTAWEQLEEWDWSSSLLYPHYLAWSLGHREVKEIFVE